MSKIFSKILIFLTGFTLTAIIGYIDRATGHLTSLALFYIIPIFLVTVYAGRIEGILMAVFSGFIWAIIDLQINTALFYKFHFYWNVLQNTIVFIIFVLLTYALKKAYQNERELSRKDFITDVANIKAFSEICSKQIRIVRRDKTPVSIVYMDCDNFKGINDSMGHEKGNVFLQVIAETVRKNIRLSDTIARVGGDEFAILLPETPEKQARVFVERLIDILSEATRENGFPVTFSMGVATFMRPPVSVDEMLSSSDGLMYAAKQSGKDRAEYETIGKK